MAAARYSAPRAFRPAIEMRPSMVRYTWCLAVRRSHWGRVKPAWVVIHFRTMVRWWDTRDAWRSGARTGGGSSLHGWLYIFVRESLVLHQGAHFCSNKTMVTRSYSEIVRGGEAQMVADVLTPLSPVSRLRLLGSNECASERKAVPEI
jgi:hypothetical protein